MDELDIDARSLEIFTRFYRFLIGQSLLTPNENEKLLLNKLQGLVTNIKWSPTDAADLFDALLKRFLSTTTDRTRFFSWMMEILHCIEINYITPSWRSQTGKGLTELVRDKTITDENLKICVADDRNKELDEIIEEIRQEKLNQTDDKLLEEVRDIVSSVNKDLNSKNGGSQRSDLKKDLLRICQAVEKVVKFRPYITQMVSWCIMALSKTGRLIQVGTGEGKSCIVAMFAAFRALRGQSVDIMSSSPVLAERDLDEWKKFYEALKITVSCNSKRQDEELKKCYKCQVVYGTVENFAADWLKQNFLMNNIFGQRKFQCAIVDEVDSLMLDKGHHVVYIGSDMPALQHLNPLLALIWATVDQYSKTDTGTTMGPKYHFHQVVLQNITKDKDMNEFTILQMAEDTGILDKGSVNTLRRNPSLLSEKTGNVTVSQLAKFFKTVEKKFPSCHFALHKQNNDGQIEELNKTAQIENGEKQRVPLLLIDGGFCRYLYSGEESVLRAAETEIKRSLHFTPCELNNHTGSCYVPGFLSDLVRFKLKVWIKNAFKAKTMTVDHEYVLEKHGIVPVDYSCTGVVENFMTWSDGLHQFLEMKHMYKMSDMTVITNYMSNVGLLQMYRDQIFGMSGTLGEKSETETLQQIYKGIKTCQIPSFKRRKLFEVEGVVVQNEDDWIRTICDTVTAQTKPTLYRKERAVLIICETIKRAKVLHKALEDNVPNKKLYINNNMDNSGVIQKKLDARQVIIATNLAGRGTDLQVSEDVKAAGGLFVVQTFLPRNARVEAQAFGRTARQGSPGSAQLVVCTAHLSEEFQFMVLAKHFLFVLKNVINVNVHYQDIFLMSLRSYLKSHINEQSADMSSALSKILSKDYKSDIKIAKEVRDSTVADGLDSYLRYYIPEIKKKAELFNQYLDTLKDVYKKSDNRTAVSAALNEFWGMWLLTNFSENESISELKSRLRTDLHSARQKLSQGESPLSNLHHYSVFGSELRSKGRLAESIKTYTKAIQEDRCWAAIAYYNRAFASLTLQGKCQDQKCIDEALQDLQNALKSVELFCEQIEVTQRYSKQQIRELSGFVFRFDLHIITRYKVLIFFIVNINEAIKMLEKARQLGRNVKVEESLVYFMVPIVDCLPLATLLTQVSAIRSRDPLKMRQLISDPSFDLLHELMCLESLGLTHVYTLDTRFTLSGFFKKIQRSITQA